MSGPESPASAALEALGYALFLRDETGALRLHGNAPAWLSQLWKGFAQTGESLPLTEISPFLENFLIDAEEYWTTGASARVLSGPWIEQSANGAEVSLEATALTVNRQAALLVERLGEVFEAKKAMLQTARETVIAYQRLNSETQKKEILLSCIAEEMNAALANAITALRLIEMEKHSPRAQQLLTLAMRATEDQQALINKVLNVFAAELEGLYGHRGSSSAAASLFEVLRQAEEAVVAGYAEKRVELQLPNDDKTRLTLAMDAGHLTRVVIGLLENALQNAPAESVVSLAATKEEETARLEIVDHGATLPPTIGDNFFSKDVTTTDEASAMRLRLQFCRMAVEKCQGEFGYEAQEEGGNCFWIRLPRIAAAVE